jgi:exopolysaccharide biosynthesis protein
MKQFLRRTCCTLLAVLLASASLSAAASEALGDDLTAKDTAIHQSTTLSTDVFWSTTYSDLRTENLITYTPNAAVKPMVTYGGTLTACNTVAATAKALESQGYRVVAGINGDFYNTSTGLPVGVVITDGIIRSSDAGYHAIGFREDGTAVLGKPAIKVSADLGYAAADSAGYSTQVVRQLAGVNKARVSTGGIYLYTYDFNSRHTTGNTEAGVDVVCTVSGGSLSIGGTLSLTVDQVVEASGATAIGQNQVVLSANSLSNSYFTDALRKIPVGATVTVTPTAAQGWENVRYAVGALYSLVENGAIVSGLAAGANPRTAVGQKADGTLVFYTIDGRQSGYSIGASLAQVAARLIELGCVSAVCLDGGGSTALTVTQPDATAAKTISSPSGGSERAVTNQVFLVASSSATGELDHFYVSAANDSVLAGSRVAITASAVDTNYIPMSRSYSLSASAGTLTDGVLTTPAAGGDITVTASGSGKSGSAVVHAVTTPDSIRVKNGSTAVTALTLTPGSTVDLSAAAVYQHRALAADADAFTWTLSGDIGTVNTEGVLTASAPGSGTLTVSAGGKSATVAVTVSKVALSDLEDFESGIPILAGYSYGTTLESSTAADTVRYGRVSGKLDYSLGADGTATAAFSEPLSVGSAYSRVNLWVRGDGSGNTLSLLTTDGSSTVTTDLTVLDFTGYKQLTAALPAGTAAISGFRIAGTASITQAEDGTIVVAYPVTAGTLYLDQLVGSYGSVVDDQAPVVTATLSEAAPAAEGETASAARTLTAAVSDAADGILPQSQVAVTVDGKSAAFSYDAKTGALTAAITLAEGDTGAHRITVMAKDASGNIGRASVDLTSTAAGTLFSDTKDNWAAAYIDWLKTAGITGGYADGTFRPGRNISRQEFTVMLCRYLGLDTARYESVSLPFADAAQIGDFAVGAVKALYSIGIVGGMQKGGKLYFSPSASLTRAQAAAMIGRTQEKGYAAGTLSFTDASAIPAYAAPYIQTLAAQGVLSGFADGSFGPGSNITRAQMAKILYNLL